VIGALPNGIADVGSAGSFALFPAPAPLYAGKPWSRWAREHIGLFAFCEEGVPLVWVTFVCVT